MHHERACASKTLCFSSSTYSLFFFFYTLLYLNSLSLSSFLLIQFDAFFPSLWLLLCLHQGLPWGQCWQHNKASGRAHRLDTHCIQLTPSSVSTSPHAQETHTHDPMLTDLTPTSTQMAWAPPRSVSVWQICTVSNTANYLFQLSFQLLCVKLLADPPPLRKPKEKMISFQLDQAQGNFPAVFTDSETRLSPVHMCGA